MQWKQLEKQLHEEAKQATALPFSIRKKAESISGIDLSKLSIVYSNRLDELPASAALYQHCIFQKSHDEFTTLHEIGHYVFQHCGFTKAQSSPPLLSYSEEQEADEFAKQSYHAKITNMPHLHTIPDQEQDRILFRLYIGNLDQKIIEKEALTLTKSSDEKTPAGLKENYKNYNARDFNKLSKRYEDYKQKTLSLNETYSVWDIYNKLCDHPKEWEGEQYEAFYYFRDELELFRYFDIKLGQAYTTDPTTEATPKPILPKINMINVGVGDSILIRTPTTYILVDLGQKPDKVDEFLSFVSSKFSEDTPLNIQSPQLHIMITHGDSDHTGGSIKPDIMQRYLKRDVICGTAQYIKQKADETALIKELEDALKSGDYHILEGESPLKDGQTYTNIDKASDGKNRDSLPFIKINDYEIQIFTGDIRMESECDRACSSSSSSKKALACDGLINRIKKYKQELEDTKKRCISDGKPLPVVLLKVPHHGSIDNLSRDFFTFMKPFCSRFILMISSEKKHKHPSISEFIWNDDGQYKLFPQGQRLLFKEGSKSVIMGSTATEQISSSATASHDEPCASSSTCTSKDDIVIDLYYTYNIFGNIGSIVHKQSSDYQASSTYTKAWRPKESTIQETTSRMEQYQKDHASEMLKEETGKKIEESRKVSRDQLLQSKRT